MAVKKPAPEPAPEATQEASRSPVSKSTAVGGLSELQAKADAITARGYAGPGKEKK